MDPQQQQLIDRIKQAQNILVTVSANPSVDQLSAAIGLTLALNKLDKHGTAVFSGQVPSTLEFLKPEETLEKNTDSLRDFIIALDKSKADKLRYKVEDDVVRIFITPYRTSLSEADLQFSQGDFNVDVVIALGVTEQQDLDTAITAHGRILHDATVASVSTVGQGSLGSINWVDPTASSLSEMVVNLMDSLDKKLLDGQIATALLTGIVASTDRFRNEKTSPKTMSASAQLMAAGANQQLIATKLEAAVEVQPPAPKASDSKPSSDDEPQPVEVSKPKNAPGTLEIDHETEEKPAEPATEPEPTHPQVSVDEDGHLITDAELAPAKEEPKLPEASKSEVKHERIIEPPQVSTSNLTANSAPEPFDPPTEELTLPATNAPLLSHEEPVLPPVPSSDTLAPGSNPFAQSQPLQPAPADWQPPALPDPVVPDTTLTEIETSVDSPHLHTDDAADAAAPASNIDDARDAVEAALSGAGNVADPLEPIAALSAQPMVPGPQSSSAPEPALPPLPPPPPAPLPVTNTGFSEPTPGNSPADQTLDMPLPSNPFAAPPPPAGLAPLSPVDPSALPSLTLPTDPSAPPVPPPTAFPSLPQQNNLSGAPGNQNPPPVPPPMLPPLQ